MPISRAKGLFPQEADPLFIGLFPAGVSYANRNVEENGDHKRLAFLPYDTLALEVQKDCPLELRHRIFEDAKTIQARHGKPFRISTCGQTVIFGK
jgi:uncharacterized protein YjhX (UPF0386 family)